MKSLDLLTHYLHREACTSLTHSLQKLHRELDRLFVYGTLAPGRKNAHILADVTGEWERGYVWGQLFEEGWGSELGFPGLRMDKKIEKIEGFVLSSLHLNRHWELLDEFEGKQYERKQAEITLEASRKVVLAYLYCLK